MSKIKKFTGLKIKKITGGKDPVKLVNEFIIHRGFDPDECLKEKGSDAIRWMIEVTDEQSIEILLEGITKPSETTLYLGVNIATVPVKGITDFLASALEVADGLVGVKISLVGHFIVMSSSLGLTGADIEELDYHYMLIMEQVPWFQETLASELGWEDISEY